MTKHIKYPEEIKDDAIKAQLNRVANHILRNMYNDEISRKPKDYFRELFEDVA